MFSEFGKKLNNYKEQVSNFETNLTNEGEKFSIINDVSCISSLFPRVSTTANVSFVDDFGGNCATSKLKL